MELGKIIVVADVVLVISFALMLWFELFLPYAYFVTALGLAAFLVLSLLKKSSVHFGYVIVQLFLIYILINNLYGLYNHYETLPYGDSYWDYNVVRIFKQDSLIYTIPEQPTAPMLTWYSGWPALHVFAVLFSNATGLSLLSTVQIIPQVLSLCLFIVVYFFIREVAKKLELSNEAIYLSLLIFVLSPETIFWRTQFVRMSFGLVWLFLIFYLFFLLVTNPYQRTQRSLFLITISAFLLIASHHLVSFMALVLLLLVIGLQIFRQNLPVKSDRKIPWQLLYSPPTTLLVMMLVFTSIWWINFGTIIFPTVGAGLDRFVAVLTQARTVEFYVPEPYYPAVLTPNWAMMFLRIRDVLMFVPALVGLLVLWLRKPSATKSFIAYIMLSFGLVFLVNLVTFKIEPFRIITTVLPFVALLSAVVYAEVARRSQKVWRIVVPLLVVVLVFSSFIGLWGHNFAPVHLYDPSINRIDIGEHSGLRNLDTFVNNVSFKTFDKIWTDDFAILTLLTPTDILPFIQKLTNDTKTEEIGVYRNEIFFEFVKLNLYEYYASTYSPIKDPQEANAFSQELAAQLETRFKVVYDDGRQRVWEK